MIKKTLCFSNPAYLSLANSQLVIKLPEVEKSTMPDSFKQNAVRTIPIEDIGIVILDHTRLLSHKDYWRRCSKTIVR